MSVAAQEKATARRPLGALFARSFLVGAAWDFRRLQSVGFAWALEPALKAVWKDPRDLREARLRQLAWINTHPALSGFCLAAAGQMEEELAAAPAARRPAVLIRAAAVRGALASSCAALGDPFFWGALRPAAAAFALTAWLVASAAWRAQAGPEAPAPLWTLLAGPAAYLLCFGAPALWTRWKGVRLGWVPAEAAARELKSLPLRRWGRALRVSGFTVAAVAAAALAGSAVLARDWPVPAALALYWLARWRGYSSPALYVGTCLLLSAAAWVGL